MDKSLDGNGDTTLIASSVFDGQSPTKIFKLNVDCFEELFEWLSVADLRAFRQTCKRLKQVVDYYANMNYPLVFKRLPIRDYHLDYLRHNFSGGFEFLNHIDFLTSKLTTVQIEDIKYMLNRMESINIESMQIDGDFYVTFLQFCQSIKCLSISKFGCAEIIGSGNEWLLRHYSTLEHIILLNSRSNLDNETSEMVTFFYLNPQIHSFTTTFEFLWINRHWMLESEFKLNQLNIIGSCNTKITVDSMSNLLHELFHQGFYKRLHMSVSWMEEHDDFDQIISLNGLEKLSLKSISIRIKPPKIESLKELNIYAYEYFEDLQVHKFIGLERIYIAFASINDILPFIRYCGKLKQIVVNHLELQSSNFCESGIINLAALNVERTKLPFARHIAVYVNEKCFLKHKWTSKIKSGLIELKRAQSWKREQLFW